MFIATLSGGTSPGARPSLAQICPHIGDVEFQIQIGRAIGGSDQGASPLQRALVRAGGTHVERDLSVLHPHVAVEVLE